MSRETERIMREMARYIEANAPAGCGPEDLNALAQRFMDEYNASLKNLSASFEPETADDCLYMAEKASSKKAKLKYVEQALEMDPEHLDALRLHAELTAKNRQELLETLTPLVEEATRKLRQDGSYEELKGNFWNAIETRPYMRLRYLYLETLADCGMMRRAAEEGEELLDLCEDDNMGVRYDVMHLYAYLEDEAAALALFRRQEEYAKEETQLLLPLSVLFYKRNQFDRALEYLELLGACNKDTKKFLVAVANNSLERYYADMSPYGYRPACMDELIYAYHAFDYLYYTVPQFFSWAKGQLTAKRGRPPRGKRE